MMARNIAIAAKRIWTDHRCVTREVLSEPRRSLTRVPHRWMDLLKEVREPMLGRQLDMDIHRQSGHPGAKRTLYFARLFDPQVSKETANSVVKACKTC